MVFREVSVIEVREALRAWLAGKSERAVAAVPARSPGSFAWPAWPMLRPGRSRPTPRACASGSG